jgi:uncharacterized membrane protein HdeD (DUF308 family)
MEALREQLKERIGDWAATAAKNAGWLMALGALVVISGLVAIAHPWASGRAIATLIGIALVIAGVARTLGTFQAGSFGQGALALTGGILTVLAGLMLMFMPGLGLATLTLLVAGYLLVDGIAGSILAFRVRPEKGWGPMLFSAAMSALLAILLFKEWPLSGLWAIGTLVGINLLFAGFSMISVGSAVRGRVKQLK